MIGSVFDKLDSWLGRSFLLASYVPCLIFSVLNLVLVCLESLSIRTVVAAQYKAAGTSISVLSAALGVATVAFAISPLTRLATLLLEGETLPRWIAEPLLLLQAERREDVSRDGIAVQQRRAQLPPVATVIDRLKLCRAAGMELRCHTDPQAIDAAERMVGMLRDNRLLNRPVDVGLFLAAVAALSTALSTNCADLFRLGTIPYPTGSDDQVGTVSVSADDKDLSDRLSRLHDEMRKILIPYVITIAEQSEARIWDQRSRLFAESELAPTRLGNEAAELRSYCRTRYGFEFDFFWPRLQLVIQKDDKISAAIVRAKIQVDFSIMCLVLTVTTGVIWLAYIACFGRSPRLLVPIAVLVPPLTYLWLRIIHTSYAEFSELVRSAVDLTRRNLLKEFGLTPPASAEDEKKLWNELGMWLILNGKPAGIRFAEPKAT